MLFGFILGLCGLLQYLRRLLINLSDEFPDFVSAVLMFVVNLNNGHLFDFVCLGLNFVLSNLGLGVDELLSLFDSHEFSDLRAKPLE